jgi:carbamoyl-phosphate synthase large subunit
MYVENAVGVSPERPVLIDKFLENAIESEADAICDGTEAFMPAVMEHIELAGVHSGDSACVIPPVSIPQKHLDTIEEYTCKIAVKLGVVGLINVQYAISNDMVYVLEANPRASRTVPIVSKVCGLSMARLATQVMLGKTVKELQLRRAPVLHFGVKESVLPFNMFPEVDPVLGPEMRSTGEVLGLADNWGEAYYKSQEAASSRLPLEGTVLITVADADKAGVLEAARRFVELGFTIKATEGTQRYLTEHGIPSERILKIHEGRPHIADSIENKEIHLVINTPLGRLGAVDDSYIRKAAIKQKLPYITTVAAALAAVRGIASRRQGHSEVKSLQEYHAALSR